MNPKWTPNEPQIVTKTTPNLTQIDPKSTRTYHLNPQVASDPSYSWVCDTVMQPVTQAQEELNQAMDDFTKYLFSGASPNEIKKSFASKDVWEILGL